MIDDLDLDELRRIPRISYYFRYPLRRRDFRELNVGDSLRGHYAAKPLYAGFTPDGRVDRAAGYNGDIAALFVPLAAREARDVSLVLAHVAPQDIVLAGGRRNWPVIHDAAERSIRAQLA